VTENQNAARDNSETGGFCGSVSYASTRMHDGSVFGLGAEIGISTQKLHARGTMGVQELTTTKYVGLGNGQIAGDRKDSEQ